MSMIVAARFMTFDAAAAAAGRLQAAGISQEDIHTFYVNSAGAHDRYPLGGDQRADPDAGPAQYGAITGAAVGGLALGAIAGVVASVLAATALALVAAVGVGAYVGALFGALWVAGRGRRPMRPTTAAPATSPPGADAHAPVRHAGVMLALHVDGAQAERALAVLRDAGGLDLERAHGRWVDGKWEDFDPLQPPQLAAGG
ncbi:hypothetical protein CUR95_20815 [Bordetella bronchiseptica]|nr:hypothetical protein [Bordetella bronchiseptica]